jgi:hypothetical protein
LPSRPEIRAVGLATPFLQPNCELAYVLSPVVGADVSIIASNVLTALGQGPTLAGKAQTPRLKPAAGAPSYGGRFPWTFD